MSRFGQLGGGYSGQAMPALKERLPSTLERAPKKVQNVYLEALDSAHATYRSEERAHRTAWAAVKHVAEKRGDTWKLKDKPGPSDPQARQRGRTARERPKRTAGGYDVESATKEELYDRAKELGIKGRSRMNKRELATAVRKRAGRTPARRRR